MFDECHKAKNASSTKMGKAVLDLQNKLPLARVVYASATGEGQLPGAGREPNRTCCHQLVMSVLVQPWRASHVPSVGLAGLHLWP